MTAKNRKLCPNCDGSVHIHATKCPYCGFDLAGQPSSFATQEAPPPPSPYVPEPEPPMPPYSSFVETEEEVPPQEEVAIAPAPEVQPAVSAVPSSLAPMFLLIPGAFFLLFGMILLLFSRDGVVTLSWNAHYWFVYLALGAPLLYFGWRFLHRHESEATSSS